MTTQQAPVGGLRQPQASSAERIRELESENKALREEIECLETEAEMAEEQLENAALRQGALTEGDRERLAQIKDWYEGVRPADLEHSHIYELFDIIDRLTAAPASQVTREEIAWIVFEAKAGPYLTHWPAVYSSSWTFKAADAIMSLLASRGLVKEV